MFPCSFMECKAVLLGALGSSCLATSHFHFKLGIIYCFYPVCPELTSFFHFPFPHLSSYSIVSLILLTGTLAYCPLLAAKRPFRAGSTRQVAPRSSPLRNTWWLLSAQLSSHLGSFTTTQLHPPFLFHPLGILALLDYSHPVFMCFSYATSFLCHTFSFHTL